MYISNLKIENYRNFKDFSIKLKPLTLIIGENNIGKSNLLDSIGLVFSQDVSFFRKRVLEISDFNHSCIVSLKRQILDESVPPETIVYPEIRVTATLVDWSSDQESVIADWYSNSGLTEATLTYQFAPVASFDKIAEITQQRAFVAAVKTDIGEAAFNAIGEKGKLDLINFPISKYYYSIFGGSQRDTQANAYHLNQLKFELLDALRDAETELVASHSGRLLFRILNSKEDTEYQDLKAKLLGLQKAIDENTALRAIKLGISTQLDKVSLRTAGIANDVNFIFSLPEVDDLLKKISLIYGSDPIKIERNGTGRNNLLFISLILSYIEDITRVQSSYFRIVGLEEPEAHLHPNLQDHLATNVEGLLKVPGGSEIRKDIQILLTSHSTYITTKIKFDNTVVIYDNGGAITPYYVFDGFPDTAQGKKNRKYLNKYLDAANANLFYSRRIILVEGISEKLLIPVFFKLHKTHTLEEASCCIVNVNGLAFANFLEIIKDGYFIKCLVLTDSDAGTAVENRGATLATEYSAVPQIKVQITSHSTFEKDVIDANKTGQGKGILLKALLITRPVAGKIYEDGLSGGDIVVDDFFALIVSYKSEFAYNLLVSLSEDSAGFNIPPYITTGFDFITS
jgi:putative ATP-dependent endonuclease of the OLD family